MAHAGMLHHSVMMVDDPPLTNGSEQLGNFFHQCYDVTQRSTSSKGAQYCTATMVFATNIMALGITNSPTLQRLLNIHITKPANVTADMWQKFHKVLKDRTSICLPAMLNATHSYYNVGNVGKFTREIGQKIGADANRLAASAALAIEGARTLYHEYLVNHEGDESTVDMQPDPEAQQRHSAIEQLEN